jgi:hypothetical protein
LIRIVSFIDQRDVIRKILEHLALWEESHAPSLQCNAKDYDVVLNGKPLTLPHDAFPTSVWHYKITQKSLLFDLKDLRLMKVKVSESKDAVSIGERSIPASRFDFSGEWEISVWYDQNKQLLKIKYKIRGREVVVTMDPK